MTTPKLQMPELVVGQAGKELTHNQALAVLDQLAQAVVVDKDLTTPPGSPANGAMYIVAAGATGAWSGQSGKLAYWINTVAEWTFITPADGWSVWVTDEAVRYERKSGAWVIVAAGGGGVSSTYADATISGGALTLNLATAQTFGVMLNSNVAVLTLAGSAAGQRSSIDCIFSQAASGGFSAAPPANLRLPSGVASIASADPRAITYVRFTTVDNGTSWLLDKRVIFDVSAPLSLPPIAGENATMTEEGAAIGGWTLTGGTSSVSSSVLRVTKTDGVTASQLIQTAVMPAAANDHIVYAKLRASTDGGCVLWLINGAGDKVTGVWLNANDLGGYSPGTIAITGWNGSTRTGMTVASGVNTATAWVDVALQFDKKFSTVSCYFRQPSGLWELVGRVAHTDITPANIAIRSLGAAPGTSWFEYDYVTVARPNLVVIGDSIAEGKTLHSPNLSLALSNYQSTWTAHVALYPSLRNNLPVNKGVGSETSTATLARIADATGVGAKAVFIHASTNDQTSGVSQATRTSNLQAMVNAVNASGAGAVLLNAMYGTSTLAANPAHRDYCLLWWGTNKPTLTGVYADIDIMQPLLSGGFMDDTLTQPDDIHPSIAGYTAVGNYIQGLL